jgi:hypothetical protein
LTVAYHVEAADATYGANPTTRICCNYYAYRTTDIRFGLEHPRPSALRRDRLSGSSAGNPATIEKVKAVLEKHPWYGNQWQARLPDVPDADHGLVSFMQAARWGRVFP